ncbi:MAG TPA: thiamine-phosphate kinase [Gammaproteobacteria bacterium]|nr:thiamine-phosphate kinase [Gammaproteobacteria bacterium]
MNEFDVIKHFFTSQKIARKDVALGIGDDAAIITPHEDQQIVITTDTLINGVHFPEKTAAYDIGFKALAVNLSDLAAMGATPAWLTLALTLPSVDETWLKEFSRGFFDLAEKYNAELIGGDLTKGPLTVTIQALGLVPFNQAITRSGAKPGDLIYVTNTLGDAAFALVSTEFSGLKEKLNRPTPQIKIGEQLRGIAHAAIDISDGLVADLGHILEKSNAGAEIHVDALPLSDALRQHINKYEFALNGGDDYELCFTVPENKKNRVPKNCTCIGKITDSKKINLLFSDGTRYDLDKKGYQHF